MSSCSLFWRGWVYMWNGSGEGLWNISFGQHCVVRIRGGRHYVDGWNHELFYEESPADHRAPRNIVLQRYKAHADAFERALHNTLDGKICLLQVGHGSKVSGDVASISVLKDVASEQHASVWERSVRQMEMLGGISCPWTEAPDYLHWEESVSARGRNETCG